LNAYAEVNWGRWIAKCPVCKGAEFARDETFFCKSCKNEFNGGLPIPLIWPKERWAIDHLLEKRLVKNRHYLVTDTVDTLKAENVSHSLTIDIPEKPVVVTPPAHNPSIPGGA